MQAVILAGGLGTRLGPFTKIIPKPLLPIGEKSVLEIQIDHLRDNGFTDIFLATNYMSEYIENFFGDGRRYGIKLTISKESKPLGTVGPLTLLKKELTKPFLVMNGDILTLLNYAEFYKFSISRDSLLTVAVKELVTPFQFGNIFFEGDYVTGIEEKPDIRKNILAGIYVFKPELFEIIPDDQYFGMDTLINIMLESKMPITKYMIQEYWLDIGQADDYYKAQEDYKNRIARNKV